MITSTWWRFSVLFPSLLRADRLRRPETLVNGAT
jgi:hypothetical protein